jgi:hypothetical protein
LREHWPIGAAARGPLIQRLLMIALDSKSKPRDAVAAAKAVLAASRINLAAIDAEIRAAEHEQLAEIVADLEARAAEPRGRF